MQAVILAGGLGTRLRPLTDTIPKPMVLVRNRPFLEHLFALLKENGIVDILVLTGHLGEVIENHFGDGSTYGLRVVYSQEHEPLGHGGALHLAYEKLADSFVLLYGDNFLPIDYRDLVNFYTKSGKEGVVVSYQFKDESERGDNYSNNLCVDEEGCVTGYEQRGVPNGTHAEAGAMVFNKKVLEYIGEGYTDAIGNVLFPELIRRGELITYVSPHRFYDIGTPQRLKEAEVFFGSRK
ncbi:MAG: NTP transferase domain-containing protein [Parcubacteria group bacterium]|nr:NTP transferase domain-containing protein [Parcubacteria group bacterium]